MNAFPHKLPPPSPRFQYQHSEWMDKQQAQEISKITQKHKHLGWEERREERHFAFGIGGILRDKRLLLICFNAVCSSL